MQEMRIALSRTGGFTGIPFTKTVDTATMTKEEREKIEGLIKNNPINQYANLTAGKAGNQTKPIPDQFIYTISVQDGEKEESVTIQESGLSPELQKLINLMQ